MPDLGGAGAPVVKVTVRAVKETAEVRGTVARRVGLYRWSLHTLVTRGLALTTTGSPVMVTLTPRPAGRRVTGENVALFTVQP